MFEITVLVDNNTITDKYFLGEPALSILVESDDVKLLFDTGYSDVFLKNAKKLGKDLKNLDYIVLSHGHNDHTGGLRYLVDLFKDSVIKPKIVACPDVFEQRYDSVEGEFGSFISKEKIESNFDVCYKNKPYFLSENIVFLGQIPRQNNFEAQNPVGINKKTNEADFILDDSAIAINTQNGIVIITGCSHSGIVNICEHAKSVCKKDRIVSIIGGLHLKDADEIQLSETVEYLKKLDLESLHSCHCTGFQAQCRLNFVTNLNEVGSGLQIDFEHNSN